MSLLIENFRETSIENWYWFENALTSDEMQAIDRLQQSIDFRHATILEDNQDLAFYRKSDVKWLSRQNREHLWLYEKFISMVTEANNALWNFELTGIFDDIQYTVYREDGGHYDWHMDIGNGKFSRRKISVTLQLSEPDEYEGGDFEFLLSKDVTSLPRKKGCAIVFPSFFLHRVAPVTKGIRKSLVLWVAGQPYR